MLETGNLMVSHLMAGLHHESQHVAPIIKLLIKIVNGTIDQ